MMDVWQRVLREFAPLVPAILPGLIQAIRWIESQRRVISVAGFVVLFVVIATPLWQLYQIYRHATDIRTIATERVANFGTEDGLTEVSAATVFKDSLYVAEDEPAEFYEVTRNPIDRTYAKLRAIPLGLDVTDLEAMEAHGDKIYLLTSHSNTKKGKENPNRRWLLEMGETPWRVLRSQTQLRQSIEALFAENGVARYSNLDKQEEVMNIEGLAIDDQGVAYLGFRAPLLDGYALLLRATLESLFDPSPKLELFRLDLRASEPPASSLEASEPPGSGRDRRANGITSLAFDPISQRIVILSNSQHRDGRNTPILWLLDPSNLVAGMPVQPDRCSTAFASGVGKPEALAIWPAPRPERHLDRLHERVRGARGEVEILYDVADAPAVGQRFQRSELCRSLARRAS